MIIYNSIIFLKVREGTGKNYSGNFNFTMNRESVYTILLYICTLLYTHTQKLYIASLLRFYIIYFSLATNAVLENNIFLEKGTLKYL